MKIILYSCLLFLLFFITIRKSKAHSNETCLLAPTKDLRTICNTLVERDRLARMAIIQQEQEEKIISPPGVPEQPNLIPRVPRQINPTPYSCMDMQCLCPYFRGNMGNDGICYINGGVPLRPCLRKEYRALSDDERHRFHNAIRQLKANGEYDRFSVQHRDVGESPPAHSGPGFLPWHREFLKRVEIALRMIDQSLCIPYWDSVLDSYLPDPKDSIIWTSEFVGATDFAGNVVNGPFAGFRTLEGKPTINRQHGHEGHMFRESDLNTVFSQNSIDHVLGFTAPQPGCPFPPFFGALEYAHSNIHIWIGGDMKPPVRSANDPIFYLHHSFVDYIWEIWRTTRQTRWTREIAYPPDIEKCSNVRHFSTAQMSPFNIQNIQGLSNAYTDNMYTYAPRPTCSRQNPNCGSNYMFCDARSFPHCVGKIRMGGLCTGFEGLDACDGGVCLGGRCVPGNFNGQRSFNFQQQQQSSPTQSQTPSPQTSPQSQSRTAFSTFSRQSPFVTTTQSTPQLPRQPPPVTFAPQRPRQPPPVTFPPRRIPPPPVTQRFNPFITQRPNTSTSQRFSSPFRQTSQRFNPFMRSRNNNFLQTLRPPPQAPFHTTPQPPPPLPPQSNQASGFNSCFNSDPCCRAWSRKGECSTNAAYMNQYCRRSCRQCTSPINRAGCVDQHPSCNYWRSQGECLHRRQWMAENCQASCGWCNMSKAQLCVSAARWSLL